MPASASASADGRRRWPRGLFGHGFTIGSAALPLFAASLVAGCVDDATRLTPSETPVSTPTATAGPTYAANPAFRVPLGDLDALVGASHAVVVVQFERQLPDHWSDSSPQLMPLAQFSARVTQVVAGPLNAGDMLTVRLPGGTIRETGDPSPGGSGFRPQPDDATKVIQYEDAPFPAVGSQELVFLIAAHDTDGTNWYGLIPEGRLIVDGSTLRSPLAAWAPNLAGPGSLPAQLSALTLDEIERRVKAGWVDRIATPTARPTLDSSDCHPGPGSETSNAAIGFSPFCVVWRDRWNDETGFIIELKFDRSGERFEYSAKPDQTSLVFPLEAAIPRQPTQDCIARKDFQVTVQVRRSSGEIEPVDSTAVELECGGP